MHYWGQPYTRGLGFWPGGLIEFALMILFWIALAFLILALVRGFKRQGTHESLTYPKGTLRQR
jgi:hypothetical protein